MVIGRFAAGVMMVGGLTACAAQLPAAPTDDDADPTGAGPTTDTAARGPAPLTDADRAALAAGLEAFAALLPTLNLAPVREVAEAFEQLRDPTCPGDITDPLIQGIHHDCTTRAGLRILGSWGPRPEAAARVLEEERTGTLDVLAPRVDASWTASTPLDAVQSTIYAGYFLVEPPPDGLLSMNGSGYDLRIDAGAVTARAFSIDGPLDHSQATSGTWLSDGLRLDIGMAWLDGPDGRVRQLRGTIAGFEGPYVAFGGRVEFDQRCPAEPYTPVDARSVDGLWLTVAFDGAAACDGCAPVLRAGVPVGEVCVDMSAGLAPPAAYAVVWP